MSYIKTYTGQFVFTHEELIQFIATVISEFMASGNAYNGDTPEEEAEGIMAKLVGDESIPFDGSPILQPDSVGGVADLGLEPVF